MATEQVILDIPEAILRGLQNGTYERIGGIVREVASKRVVAWLRETGASTLETSIGVGIPGLDPINVINGIIVKFSYGRSV